MENTPCNDCKERTHLCHAKCEKYIAFDKKNKKRRAETLARNEAFVTTANYNSRTRQYKIQKAKGGYK